MRKLYTFPDVEQEFKRVYRKLASSGSGSVPGIDDVLSENQPLSTFRTINLNGESLHFLGPDNYLLALSSGGDKSFSFSSGAGTQLAAGVDYNGINLTGQTSGIDCFIRLRADDSTIVSQGVSYLFEGQNLHTFLRLDSTSDDENAFIGGSNNTGFGNRGYFLGQASDTLARVTLEADFNDTEKATIVGFADTNGSSITHTADTHTFAAGGVSQALLLDGTVNSESSRLTADNATGDGNSSVGNFQTSDTNAEFLIRARFNDGVKDAGISGDANSTASSITYTADTHTFIGAVNMGYTKYVALLSQSGTSAPTVTTILDNTIGTIVWTYDSVGQYTGTLTGAFTDEKTLVFIGTRPGVVTAFRATDNTVVIGTYNTSFTLANNILADTPIEIRVYP